MDSSFVASSEGLLCQTFSKAYLEIQGNSNPNENRYFKPNYKLRSPLIGMIIIGMSVPVIFGLCCPEPEMPPKRPTEVWICQGCKNCPANWTQNIYLHKLSKYHYLSLLCCKLSSFLCMRMSLRSN